MAALSIQVPYPVFYDRDGQPLDNGNIYIGVANLDPITNPLQVYYDEALTITASQPLITNGGYVYRNGTPTQLYVNATDFSITVNDSKNLFVYNFPEGTGIGVDAAAIEYDPPFAGALTSGYTVAEKLEQYISVKDFGAVGNGVADDTTAIQAAVNATPTGTTIYFPAGTYLVSNSITINKPLVVRGAGPGSFVADTGGSYIKQTNNTKNGFTLVATVGGYAFGAWGILDVHFYDLAILGPSNANRAVFGIGVDTTVNGGDYHVRECTFNNLNIRYFGTGINLTGICYLNDFYGGCFSYNNNGFELLRGAASDRGGQTRFFGTTFSLNTNDCIRWNLDTDSGDISLFGCTLADGKRGLVINEEAVISVHGCSFELLQDSGNGAGIYTEIKEANPNTQGAKNVIGCKFSSNDASIWINKTTAAFTAGEFSWPMLIDANVFVDALALKITVPAGNKPLNSQQFVLGAANSGLSNGELSSTQISANYLGNDQRKQMITRRFAFGPTTAVDTVLINKMIVTSARVYLSANSTIFTALQIGDAANNTRYFSLNANTQALNTWVNWTAPVPEFVINDSLKLNLVIFGTAGLSGATGIFEITGYLP